MKRVLIITYYWPPSGGAGVQRWLKFSKFLPEFGWEPVVLTVDPDYATYPVTDPSLIKDVQPSLKVHRTESREWFSFYKKASGTENVPYAGFAGDPGKISLIQKIARFLRGNFFIPDPRRGWNRFAYRRALQIAEEIQLSCVVTTGPPHSTHLIGRKLREKMGVPWIADFRDPWIDIFYYRKFYPTIPAHRVNQHMEKNVLTTADTILTVSEGFKQGFLKKGPIPDEKIVVIPNGFDETDFEGLPGPDPSTFHLTYVGTLSDSYPMETFLKCLNKSMRSFNNLRLRFIGSVSGKWTQKLNEACGDSIDFFGYVDHSEAVKYMSTSSALLLVVPDHGSAKGILPGKLFEYLASSRPVIGLGPVDSDASRILKETGAGIMLDPGDEKGISQALERYITSLVSVENESKPDLRNKYSRRNLTRILSEKLNTISSG
jgi:glycosyltransferase involved in cell wall biosynthesis